MCETARSVLKVSRGGKRWHIKRCCCCCWRWWGVRASYRSLGFQLPPLLLTLLRSTAAFTFCWTARAMFILYILSLYINIHYDSTKLNRQPLTGQLFKSTLPEYVSGRLMKNKSHLYLILRCGFILYFIFLNFFC